MHKSGTVCKPLQKLITFGNLRSEIYEELMNIEKFHGVKWKRFPQLTKYLKGFRLGELTVLTGPTGSGKTTFLSEYSLDLCIQGVSTLWGNFEIRNARLCKSLLQQFARKSLVNQPELFERVSDQFSKLPMYFMPFHGSEPLDTVLATMEEAVSEHAIEHIIIDNLQFMIGSSILSRNLNRFDYQDHVVGSCRKFATKFNCHVTLVVHPRKEMDDQLSLNSIFGGAKVTQEADNVFIIQTVLSNGVKPTKFLQICKNRYDGDLGIFPLKFNKETRGFGVDPDSLSTFKEQ